MGGFKQYPEYKNSDLSFIKKVPKHWEVRRTKRFFQEIDERSELGDEELLSVSHITGVTRRSDKNITMFMAESYEGFKLCQPDDLVINIMCAWMGALGVSRYAGIVNSAYGVYRQRKEKKFVSEYLDYLVRLPELIAEYHRCSKGICPSRLRMYSDNFFQLCLFCPPLDEQRLIVHFINQKLAQIDQFICYKRRLIELLCEQKRAIIDRAVTKGVDRNVPLKPSGINWIEEVAEHFSVIRLKYLEKVQTGLTLGNKHKNAKLKTRPYLRVANVQDGHLDISEMKMVEVTESEVEGYLLKEGDVLMTEGGDFDKLGRGCVWEGEIGGCLHQNHIFAVRADSKKLNSYFLAALLSSSYGKAYWIYTCKQTTNLASTNMTILKSFFILLPKLEEQERILEFIKQESQIINQAIAQAEKEIELIEEYRTILISDAITGKIDVRDTIEAGIPVAAGGD